MGSFTILVAVVSGIILFILIAYGLVIYGLRESFSTGEDVGSRLATYVTLPDETVSIQGARRRRSGLVRWRLRVNNMLSGLASEKLNLQLISANWPITEMEYVLIRYAGTVAAFGLGWILSSIFVSGDKMLTFGPGWEIPKGLVSGIGLAVFAYLPRPGVKALDLETAHEFRQPTGGRAGVNDRGRSGGLQPSTGNRGGGQGDETTCVGGIPAGTPRDWPGFIAQPGAQQPGGKDGER
jgi:hypothetical protein